MWQMQLLIEYALSNTDQVSLKFAKGLKAIEHGFIRKQIEFHAAKDFQIWRNSILINEIVLIRRNLELFDLCNVIQRIYYSFYQNKNTRLITTWQIKSCYLNSKHLSQTRALKNVKQMRRKHNMIKTCKCVFKVWVRQQLPRI